MSALESHQLINQSSGNVEIYTPPEIVTAWREVLGEIDLDPASSTQANKSIGAKVIYTEPLFDMTGGWCADGLPIRRYRDWGGLAKPWCGRVVSNPPFGSPEKACNDGCTKKGCTKRGWHTATDLPGMTHWVNKMVLEWKEKRMIEGMMICFAATSEQWFQPLLKQPQCFLDGRTNYMLPDGTRYKGATKGSVVTYFGSNVDHFAEVFEPLGVVKVPYRRA